MPDSPSDPETPMPAGFFAATLVHTDRGLRRIDDLRIGDLVVSRSTSTDENILRPVSSVAKIEEAPIILVRFSFNDVKSESIVVAGLPHFFVSGIDPTYPEEYHDELKHLFGWQEIRKVDSLLRVKSLTDPLASMSSVKQVWKSRTASIGWTEVSRDSDTGYPIEFDDDKAFEEREVVTIHGLMEGREYLDRHESSVIANDVAMRSTVHAIEIEENLPFFIGSNGILVQPGRTPNSFTAWAHERIWED
ncbi:MAG: Hint domain-containing protein [Pyrinomonadaceae bacterium]|nr:Hint domain-containing protein [Pyrinomonadaceae bacterium]